MDSLSEALIREGIVSEEALLEIKGRSKGRSFVFELCAMPGLDEEILAGVFSSKFRFKRADLSDIPPEALGKMNKDQLLKYMCMPFGWVGKSLKLAMVDPMDYDTLQAVSFLTGQTTIPYVTTQSDLLAAVNNYYEVSTALTKVLDNIMPDKGSVVEIVEAAEEVEVTQDVFQSGKREDMEDDNALMAPAVQLVNLVIKEALNSNASDVHIEPGQNNVIIRMRIDGVLKTHSEAPKWMHSAIVSRVKIMSKLDISNRKTPQDGAIKIKVGDTPLDLRISTLPTHVGEKVVMRLLVSKASSVGLASMGLNEDELVKIRRVISSPQGIVLVTGPTGSGKTTTLHAILMEIRSEGTNIITVEDPVEYELQGITQVQVHEKAGLTFANALRSILRQDPDVVMLGEIRDLETAEIAIRASMTGHFVLSTLHTNGTAATVTRIFDIGVEPFLLSSSLQCIIAQRLVRRNCEHCLTEYTPEEQMLSSLPGLDRTARFIKGRGCSACNNTGYKGRIAVLEIMEISPLLRKQIAGRSAAGELKDLAKKEGMATLYESALEKVYKGLTTLEEVVRVISVDDNQEETCSNCGRSHTGEECTYCGKLEAETCKGCNKLIEQQWNFCPFCGKAKEREALPGPAAKPRVLIVDDEFGILKMIELSLKALDLEIHTAQNGREALDKAVSINPHLVITDINMPVMDGYALIKELRSKMQTMFVPIMILSSRDTAEDKLKGFTYGTDDYMTKPFDYTELQTRVKKLLMKKTNV